MINLVCFLEEPSAREMLNVIFQKILPDDVNVDYQIFEGKQDLDKQLVHKIKHWCKPNSCFLILRDKDSGNCHQIKDELIRKVKESGKENQTCIRIACHELESFYLGDLLAVERGLNLAGLSKLQQKRKYKTPDQLANASQELYRITKYKYSKISGSRNISPYLNLEGQNVSHSFNQLINGIKKLKESML